jgi:uncharacterized protein YigE (DUF2233 family)
MKALSRAAALWLAVALCACAPAMPTAPAAQPSPRSLPAPSTATRTPAATLTPTRTPTPTATFTPTPTPTPPAWRALVPGIEQADVAALVPGTDTYTSVYTLRINPALVDFKVRYDGTNPGSIADWQAATGSQIVMNGSFFSGDGRPVGRVVTDGRLIGSPLSYEEKIGVPGVFAVLDDTAAIYALGRSSYTPRGMRFDQALESYPVLLLPGRQPAYPEETGLRARRTVIGLDEQGYVIVVLIDEPLFSLHELAQWLAVSNLNLDTALNLDGGRSSGLMVALPPVRLFEAYVLLPIVLTIDSRNP